MVLTDQTKHEANGYLIMWGCVRLSGNLNSIDILETIGTLAVDFPGWTDLRWRWLPLCFHYTHCRVQDPV